MYHLCSSRRAFTLVEMSIVIVIIGLLMGGAFVGSSMVKQAELKAVMADYNKYVGAIKQFQQQYGNLPGDIADATNYWGDDGTNCPDAAVTDGNPGTCNGNGDGILSGGAINRVEVDRAWQHLGLAKLIDQNLSGLGAEPVLGVNAPRFRASRTIGWTFFYVPGGSASDWYAGNLKHVLTIGKRGNPSYIGPYFTPLEAYQLDSKMDDGLPSTGRVVSYKPSSAIMPNCATTSVETTAQYKQSNTKIACGLAIGF